MQNHIDDFNDVVAELKNDYNGVYAAGHSIGGRVLITSNNERNCSKNASIFQKIIFFCVFKTTRCFSMFFYLNNYQQFAKKSK